MKTIACTIAAIGLVATPAFAGTEKAPTETVSYAGLDLSTVEGQELLEQRIDSAARRVCQMDRLPTGTKIIPSEARACYAKAKASAHQQVATVVLDQQRGG